MPDSYVAVEEIARLVGQASSKVTETVYRHQFRPVMTTRLTSLASMYIAALSATARRPRPILPPWLLLLTEVAAGSR